MVVWGGQFSASNSNVAEYGERSGQWWGERENDRFTGNSSNVECNCDTPLMSGRVNLNNPGQASTDADNKQASNSFSQSLSKLLAQRQYDEALAIYSASLDENTGLAQGYKADIVDYLNQQLKSGQHENFTVLADLYLANYYDDIEVLLLLVRYQLALQYFPEAVEFLQLAASYSYLPEHSQKVNIGYTKFIQNADAILAEQQRWGELIHLYQHIQSAGLLLSEDKYRWAEIYFANGDIHLGKELLNQLLSDPLLSDKAQQLLQNFEVNQPKVTKARTYSEEIALQVHGSHFVVPMRLDTQDIRLVLDTGASMTTLSLKRYEQLKSEIDFIEIGTRMFNTANGVNTGKIYRVSVLQLGRFRLRDIEIAVLDFDMGQVADGLLGMNTLRNFRFQIDQDESILQLEAR